MQVLNVDLDGVVYPWHEQLAEYAWRKHTPYEALNKDHRWDDGQLRHFPEPTQWNFNEEWGLTDGQFQSIFRRGVQDGVVWTLGEPILDSVETLWRLDGEGWNIRIVTNRLVHKFGHKQAINATADWLDRWNVPYWDLFFTGRTSKLDVKADAYIDDRVQNLPVNHGRPILFSRIWNLDMTFVDAQQSRIIRLANWKDIYKELSEEVREDAKDRKRPDTTKYNDTTSTPTEHSNGPVSSETGTEGRVQENYRRRVSFFDG